MASRAWLLKPWYGSQGLAGAGNLFRRPGGV